MSEGKGGFTKLRHDLRTCVNQILGYSELLREEAEEVQPDFVPDLDRIGTAGNRLLSILDRLFSDESAFTAT
ncbi:MAG: histidine kinase dimerization/phospho-acceptor domain-containing protein, partial [Thermoanaerobaculia bacterium]|nr:histidine kinase dimerization/phospho-acceptor domain-containing protein [Thermoanaerobaculia bacterium]